MRSKIFRDSVKGFTLIELMVAVAVVAIIASIAYPSYRGQMMKSRRAIGQAALASGQNAMERFFTEHSTYLGAAETKANGCFDSTAAKNTGAAECIFTNQAASDFYTLTISAVTASSYTLKATPTTGKVQAGDGFLEITNTGEKHWDKNNDGTVASAEKTW
jgi:type IV pilus assembly protein PilE